ncbi:MAG: hypothetical protein QOD77_1451 [Thermoplasmata archaeon]|jgi:hypothetical protein|nr:hypothetical protein [Thermoplasmata archaeon]
MSRLAPSVAVLGLAMLLLAPGAQALAAPQLYFLRDPDPQAPVVPTPAGPVGGGNPVLDGILLRYTVQPDNRPNATTAQTRLVLPATDAAAPVKFTSSGDIGAQARIKGSPLIGIWAGASAVAHGNLTVILYESHEDGTLRSLTEATFNLDVDYNKTPDPALLVPPVPTVDPANPQNAALQAVFYEYAQLAPFLLKAPLWKFLPPLDTTFNATSQLVLAFRLDPAPGDVPTPAPLPFPITDPPAPVAAFAQLEYFAAAKPSFVLVPWAAPDPEKPPVQPPSTSSSTSRPLTSSGGTGPAGESQASPAPLAFAAVAVAALLARARRKTR